MPNIPDIDRTTAARAVLAPLFWSLVFPLSKVILRDVTPLSLVALRYMMGAAFLTAVAVATGNRGELKRLFAKDWWRMLIIGFAAVSANASQVIGLNYTSTAEGSIIAATTPVYSAILASVLLRERIGTYQIAGLLLALGGVSGIALAGGGGASGGIGGFTGTALMLFGAVAYAVYTVLGKKWNATGVPALAVGTWLGVIPFVMLAAFTEPFVGSLTSADLASWASLIALGILPTGLAVIWYFGLVSNLGAARASALLYLVPVFGVVESRVLLGEHISPGLLLGGAASLVGVALAQRQRGTSKTISTNG
ncbi:MAG: DMT family transporter [Bacillota bacterium]